jgi:hypothetical protein
MNEVRTLIWNQVFRKRNVPQKHVNKKSYSQQLRIAHTSMALDTNLKQKLTQTPVLITEVPSRKTQFGKVLNRMSASGFTHHL